MYTWCPFGLGISLMVLVLYFFSHVTSKFDGWPWKTIAHLFNATSSFVHHFLAIGEFKLELQSGNAQFGSKSTIFFTLMTLQIDVWAWKIIRKLFSMLLQALCIISFPLVNSNCSYSPATSNLGQIRRFVELCDLEIWCLTLKNNRAHLLCHFKLCASLHNRWWIQTGVTVRECRIWVKFDDFLAMWPWNLTDDIEKQ